MSRFLIATRQSAMALAQTQAIRDALADAFPDLETGIAENLPRGDRDQISRLDRHGGKGGAFVAEVRERVVSGVCQAAMHSLKDMPGNEETPGLVIGVYMARDDASDCLVVRAGLTADDIAADGGAGRAIGTNSVRRAAFLRSLFPKATIVHFRGAADTRIAKLDAGEGQKLPDGSTEVPADALVMAASGLRRVGLGDRIARLFTHDEMLPPAGQGIVAVECAERDFASRTLLSAIDDPAARTCAEAEREVLWLLDGHCNAPMAAHAVIEGDVLHLKAAVTALDGSEVMRESAEGEAAYPRELGRRVGLALLEQGAKRLIEAARV